MKRGFYAMTAIVSLLVLAVPAADACTGITLTAKDGGSVVARTIEWGGSFLNSKYVIVPRGYTQRSYTPDGVDGMTFTSQYGYVGLAVEQESFVAEGVNEEGLSGGLFYFPGYGSYGPYVPAQKASSIADLQLVAWVLGSCRTIDEVKAAVAKVRVVSIDPRAQTVHWRFTERSGRQVVLEIIGGEAHFHENTLGVLTNSPDFEWQLTNLNNYVNLYPGSAAAHQMGGVELAAFGAGSGFLGIPGDVTPPSRFVRAAFYQTTAPQQETSRQSVFQSFHILNNFDIPIGVEFAAGQIPVDMPSATQWTSAVDLSNLEIYYRTMYDGSIRCIDLKTIDFSKVKYRAEPLDAELEQPVVQIAIR